MSILRRLLLSASVATSALASPPALAELRSGDIGGWGGAWGEEIIPEQPPVRRAPAPGQPTFVPTPAAVPARSAAPKGPRPADIGGWGDAWGDEIVPQPLPPRPQPAAYEAPAPSVPQPSPARPGPSPADIGGWGEAWQAPSGAAIAQAEAGAQTETPSPAAGPATAEPPPGDGSEPVQLVADQIVHDRELGIVTANGNVEIVQTGRTLTADTVSYNLKQDVISASGNVTLLEPDGNIVFAEYFELTGDFKEGVAREIRVLLADRSRMRASNARRVAGNRTDYDDVAYTACEPCRNDPDRRPLWEAKAKEATHNQAEKTIEYRDVWMELGGIPIAYSPYLSHPDPTVKRKSGFLVPTAGVSSTLGTNVTVPYFWAIRDNQDATFSPRFLFPKSEVTRAPEAERADREILRRMVLAGEHRWVGSNGETKTVASLTAHKRTGEVRGHVDARGRFDLSDVWRAGYRVERQSDDNYSTIYGYPIEGERPWLTTRPYVEGFGRNNYAMAEGFAFQSTRVEDDPGRSPLVLPHAIYSYVGEPGRHGGYWTLDADTLAYARSEGADAGRLSTQVAWNRPYVSPDGQLYKLVASLRGDGYHANGAANDGSSGRVVPQLALNWRFPFAETSGHLSQVIEPMAMVAVSPNGGNPTSIPNEDAIDFELDDINVLRANRLPGLDRVEGGLRGAYGLRWSAYPGRQSYIVAQVAQGWRAHADSTFSQTSGFEDELSDYVGRLDVSPVGNLALLNRIRLDKDSLDVRRNENTISVGPQMLRLSATYLMFEGPEADVAYDRRQYLVYSVSSEISRYWSLLASSSHDLTEGGGHLGWATRLMYSDECFAFVTNLRRYNTTDREMLSGYDITFNVVFKTLGDIPVNVF